MKTLFKILTGIIVFFSASCLRKDLPTLPLYTGNEITNVYIEYRYEDTTDIYNGEPVVAYQKLNIQQDIDTSAHTISLTLTVPPASGSFTDAERDKVMLTGLWPYFDVSTAATIKPLGDTPRPGDKTDCSKPLSYEVVAANGQAQKWTIIVKALQK